MAYPRVREQHIAVFGESGSGKTVLVSSFFGATQDQSFSSEFWRLIADDTGQGNRLYKNYLGMRDRSVTPLATRFNSTTYYFSLKLKSTGDVTAKRRPFDTLRLAWHDYPGDWFQISPSSKEEIQRRTDTFRSLLRSDVAFLLVDGQKLLDYAGEEERYLKLLMTNFRQGLLRLKDDLLDNGQPLVEFPRIWILALSKADLLPDWNAYTFRDLLIDRANEDLDELRATIQELIDTPEALALGEDFMVLSSAKFSLASGTREPTDIDLTQRVGLDLILPIASLLPLERRVRWAERMQIGRRVLESLADGAEMLAQALIGEESRARIWIKKKIPKVSAVAEKAAPSLALAAELAGDQLKKVNEEARAQHDYLTATLTQFKLDLDDGVEGGLFIRSNK